jgi:hypothetical protein
MSALGRNVASIAALQTLRLINSTLQIAERLGKLVERDDRRIALSSLQIAQILLTEPDRDATSSASDLFLDAGAQNSGRAAHTYPCE